MRRRALTVSGIGSVHVISLVSAFILMSGCDRTPDPNIETNNEPITPFIGVEDTPDFWVFQSAVFRRLHADLDLPDSFRDAVLAGEVEHPVVDASIVNAAGDTVASFRMLDDGGFQNGGGVSGYLHPESGDLIPNDFSFSAQINATFAPDSGVYRLKYWSHYPLLTGKRGETDSGLDAASETLDDSSEVQLYVKYNVAPVVQSFDVPDSLLSGFSPQVWTAQVIDDDLPGGDIIRHVELTLVESGISRRSLQMAKGSGNDWTYAASATFSAGLQTGTYHFILTAQDRFEVLSEPDTSVVWLENTAPILDSFIAPDTAVVPLEGQNLYFMFIIASDAQGQGDLERVYYDVRPPGGEFISNDEFVFQNTGVFPDTSAMDEVWSAGFITSFDNTNFGEYIFRARAIDRAGNEASFIDRTVVLVQEGGAL